MNRKNKLNSVKQKLKTQVMNQNVQAKPVREIPVWKSHETIEMLGFEFEAIFNYINGAQAAYAAVQNIMNRNLVNGKVELDFEKLSEDGTSYVPMTEDEKAPHKEQFKVAIEAAKAKAQELQNESKIITDESVHSES